MLQDSLKLKGRVGIVVKDKEGLVIEQRDIENLVVNDGLNFICSRMKDTTQAAMSHMAVGTNATAVAAGNTTLGTEVARVAITSTTVSTNTTQYVATFAAGTGTGALVEAGILNASSSGDMLCHVTYAVINKAAADSMVITWTITLTAS